MSIKIRALEAPTRDTINEWLNTPRPARCGELFTPAKPMWNPDRMSHNKVNWQAAINCVPIDWQRWLHAVLAYRMSEVQQGTVGVISSVLSRAASAGINPLNADHLVDLRERFNRREFSCLVGFMEFWQGLESIEMRPSSALLDAYKNLPRKKEGGSDPVLSLDPDKGPFNQVEQNTLHQWLHEQFCNNNLDPERYLFVRLLMIYGQRGCQIRMLVFEDFIHTGSDYKIRIYWAKQRDDNSGFRAKSETFNIDEDLYKLVQSYKAIILERLKREYPGRADWDKAIKHIPLFRRKSNESWSISGKAPLPVLVEDSDYQSLESEAQARFHVSSSTVGYWLRCLESMPDFPISPRTHQKLKISRGHRFRYTLGTDLSNIGLDEWSMAHALMHKNTRSVRKYRQVSAKLMSLIDEKMNDHLALVVNAFTGNIVRDRASAKNGDRYDRQIEDLAICGADALCHLDTPFSCYACSKFQPLLHSDHSAALDRMEQRRRQTIATDKITGALWDRSILACRKVILDCKALRESSNIQGHQHE